MDGTIRTAGHRTRDSRRVQFEADDLNPKGDRGKPGKKWTHLLQNANEDLRRSILDVRLDERIYVAKIDGGAGLIPAMFSSIESRISSIERILESKIRSIERRNTSSIESYASSKKRVFGLRAGLVELASAKTQLRQLFE